MRRKLQHRLPLNCCGFSECKIEGVPENVLEVQLALSPLHSNLSLGGEYGGDSQKVKVKCALDADGNWAAGTTYIFPGNGKETYLLQDG